MLHVGGGCVGGVSERVMLIVYLWDVRVYISVSAWTRTWTWGCTI